MPKREAASLGRRAGECALTTLHASQGTQELDLLASLFQEFQEHIVCLSSVPPLVRQLCLEACGEVEEGLEDGVLGLLAFPLLL